MRHLLQFSETWTPDPGPAIDPDSPLFGELDLVDAAERETDARRTKALAAAIRNRREQPPDLTRCTRWDTRYDIPSALRSAIDGSPDDREQYAAQRLREGQAGRVAFAEDARWLLFRLLKPLPSRRDYWGLALLQQIAVRIDAVGLLETAFDFVEMAEAK